MDKKTLEKMNDKLNEIYNKYESVPMPLDEIAKDEGVLIRHEIYLDSNAGSIAYYNSQCVIQVNTFDNYRRQRFTIAHELGHYFLHNEDIPRNKTAYPEETNELPSTASLRVLTENKMWRSELEVGKELEANKFAVELLMPLYLLTSFIRKKGTRTISELADIFKVSEQAISIRLGVPIE